MTSTTTTCNCPALFTAFGPPECGHHLYPCDHCDCWRACGEARTTSDPCLLRTYAMDPRPGIAVEVAFNRHVSRELLASLSQHPAYIVRMNALDHRLADAPLIASRWADEEWLIRLRALNSGAVPIEHVATLLTDPDEEIRLTARRMMEVRAQELSASDDRALIAALTVQRSEPRRTARWAIAPRLLLDFRLPQVQAEVLAVWCTSAAFSTSTRRLLERWLIFGSTRRRTLSPRRTGSIAERITLFISALTARLSDPSADISDREACLTALARLPLVLELG